MELPTLSDKGGGRGAGIEPFWPLRQLSTLLPSGQVDIVEALNLTEHQIANAEAKMRMAKRLGYQADRLAETIIRAMELTDDQVALADRLIKGGLLVGRAERQPKDIRTLGKNAPTTEKSLDEKTRRPTEKAPTSAPSTFFSWRNLKGGRLMANNENPPHPCLLRPFFSWLHRKEVIHALPAFTATELDDPNWQWVDVDVQAKIITSDADL